MQVNNRFGYLEGLRGISSLYIVFYHFLGSDLPDKLPVFLRYATFLAQYGHFAVGFFIVLSGYCLMLPVAQSTDYQIKGGIVAYFKRRGKRILPPYYAALFLSLLALVLHQLLWIHFKGASYPLWKDFNLGNIVSHIFLVHNLGSQWVKSLDPPMWSLSTEWEIYFLFPALLLPLWRHFGNFFTLIVALLLGIAPHYIFYNSYNFDWACPWYLALFVMGMIGANTAVKLTNKDNLWHKYKPFILAINIFCIILYVIFLNPTINIWFIDIAGGIIAVSIIIYCHSLTIEKNPPEYSIVSFLESNSIIKISKFSYSLYLFHTTVLQKIVGVSQFLQLDPITQLSVRGFIGIPAALFTSYQFYLIFERPFLKHK